MKTDVIVVSSKGSRIEKALDQVERVAAYKDLPAKDALQLRLLTEEMMCMMRSITGETQGRFWIEDEDGEYQLHLKVETRMNSEKRNQLLSASTTGRNESARGLMGRLRDFFDRSADEDVVMANPLFLPEMIETSSTPTLDLEWTLSTYQQELSGIVQHNTAAAELWDELEKSVVTHVADDVKVSIKGTDAEMVILKKLA